MKIKALPAFARGAVVATLSMVVSLLQAADLSDLNKVIQSLQAQVPQIENLKIEQTRTRNKAFVYSEKDEVKLVVDSVFLEEAEFNTLMFVVAHEYAHLVLDHASRLAQKAIDLTGRTDEDKAFEALIHDPVAMENMHSENRRIELEADQLAVRWMKALGKQTCTKGIQSTFQTGGMFQPMAPTHPPYSARVEIVCGS